MLLSDKVFLITGAAGGIGRALSHYLVAHGASLTLNDAGLNVEGSEDSEQEDTRLVDLADELVRKGASIICSSEDVSQAGVASDLVNNTCSHFGRIDGIVHAAGIRRTRRLLHILPHDLDIACRTHVHASVFLAQALAKAVKDEGYPSSLILLPGADAMQGLLQSSLQSAAYGAQLALVRSLALDLRRFQVRVNAICPTAKTRANQDLPLLKNIQDGSLSPQHVAPLVAYLLSSKSEHISGEWLAIAGRRLYALHMRQSRGVLSEDGIFDMFELEQQWSLATRLNPLP